MFILVQNLDDLPNEYIGKPCEILYFSDCFNYCEVKFLDGLQFYITLKALSTQGI